MNPDLLVKKPIGRQILKGTMWGVAISGMLGLAGIAASGPHRSPPKSESAGLVRNGLSWSMMDEDGDGDIDSIRSRDPHLGLPKFYEPGAYVNNHNTFEMTPKAQDLASQILQLEKQLNVELDTAHAEGKKPEPEPKDTSSDSKLRLTSYPYYF